MRAERDRPDGRGRHGRPAFLLTKGPERLECRAPRRSTGSEHRHHGPHRCRENDYDRRILYYTGRTYSWARCTTAPPRWTGMEQEQERGITSRPPPPPPSGPAAANRTHQHHRHSGARGFHRRGGAFAARPGRRHHRARPGGRRRAQTRPVCARPIATTCRASRFVNKMDRVGADFEMCVKMVRERLAHVSRSTAARRGRVVHRASSTWSARSNRVRRRLARQKIRRRTSPGGAEDKVKEMRHHLLESIVEQDDAILHKVSRRARAE